MSSGQPRAAQVQADAPSTAAADPAPPSSAAPPVLDAAASASASAPAPAFAPEAAAPEAAPEAAPAVPHRVGFGAPSGEQANPEDVRIFGVLEVDTDNDSTLGDEVDSTTTSIRSAVTDYKFEFGRRYHAYQDGKYFLPNDDEEIKRLELQHLIWRIFLEDRPGLAPIGPQLRRALDIGCGTGSWAIDFAETHPACHVTGADLSPIQPIMVPANCEFIVDDFTSDWLYPHRFDYIHSRSVQVGIRDWEKLIDEVWKNLEPGGWVELQEYAWPFRSSDGSLEKYGPNFKLWNESVAEGSRRSGVVLDAVLQAPELLTKRGFVNLGTCHTKWPVGTWTKGKREKKVGALFMQDMLSAFEGVSLRMFTKVLGWTHDEVLKHIQLCTEEMMSGKMHLYFPMEFVWAQKPLDAVD